MQEFAAVRLQDDVNVSTILFLEGNETQPGNAKASSPSNATLSSLSRRDVFLEEDERASLYG